MELKDFDFNLPEDLIAQHPLEQRDSSRLMVLNRSERSVSHRQFRDIKEYFREGDLLILNNTKVIPTRVYGKKHTGGRLEFLLIERLKGEKEVWRCLIKNSKGLKKGSRFTLDNGIEAIVAGVDEEGLWNCEFSQILDLEAIGRIPLPPYIRREADEEDRIRYQTVFAGVNGAVAAPTAGLHFTEEILGELKGKGVGIDYITLHTGPGTFMPVRVDNIQEHKMLKERYEISPQVFERIANAKKEKRRVIAVGTTSTRALEASVRDGFESPRLEGSTDLFIYPGFEFKVIDALLTNFHLPGSTLIMLVSAFAGHDFLLKAYSEAVEEKYRFFSYGDAMLIV